VDTIRYLFLVGRLLDVEQTVHCSGSEVVEGDFLMLCLCVFYSVCVCVCVCGWVHEGWWRWRVDVSGRD
jgi:hypothetical protein